MTESLVLITWTREDQGQRVSRACEIDLVTVRSIKTMMEKDQEDSRNCLDHVAISRKKTITSLLLRGHGHRVRRVF